MAARPRGSVQHLASRVTGRLRPDARPWDALATSFPAITATGVSKRSVLQAVARRDLPGSVERAPLLNPVPNGREGACDKLRSVALHPRFAIQQIPEPTVHTEDGEMILDTAPIIVIDSMLGNEPACRRVFSVAASAARAEKAGEREICRQEKSGGLNSWR
ncbi:chorismate-binding protein [Streptomyces sp. VB1]|uniref:chorismate-binding protein n=1 Tax=Streptomyces sp. VB1 TaxID=2986803 RepID=UPI002ADD8FEA|nr:chorismate-binding protein [Streptomyces sp. VB1]